MRTVRRVRAAAEGAARTAPPPLVRIVTRVVGALRDIEPFDRAMSLAAQAFTGLFPLLIAVAVLVPHDPDEVVDGISDSLSLPASTRTVVEQLLPQQSGSRGLVGIVGLFITLISATSFSRALARMYGRVWGVRPTGWGTGAWRWVATLVGVALFAVLIRFLRAVIGGTVVATLGQLVTTMVLGTLLWTWVPWLLLGRQVGWRWLLPGGLLMGIGMVGTTLASGIYLPRALVSTSRQFGALGVAFTYIGWLFVIGSVLVATTAVGEVSPGPDRGQVPRIRAFCVANSSSVSTPCAFSSPSCCSCASLASIGRRGPAAGWRRGLGLGVRAPAPAVWDHRPLTACRRHAVGHGGGGAGDHRGPCDSPRATWHRRLSSPSVRAGGAGGRARDSASSRRRQQSCTGIRPPAISRPRPPQHLARAGPPRGSRRR